MTVGLAGETKVHASLVESGFNDATGINGDGIVNNVPFDVHGASLDGQGGTEPRLGRALANDNH